MFATILILVMHENIKEALSNRLAIRELSHIPLPLLLLLIIVQITIIFQYSLNLRQIGLDKFPHSWFEVL